MTYQKDGSIYMGPWTKPALIVSGPGLGSLMGVGSLTTWAQNQLTGAVTGVREGKREASVEVDDIHWNEFQDGNSWSKAY